MRRRGSGETGGGAEGEVYFKYLTSDYFNNIHLIIDHWILRMELVRWISIPPRVRVG